ncbi:MAG: RNA 2',3'-cyclic phosphodiesterase [Deltaproteobacteria bacterium]|nr:RNA 2',3'-cyclic phosphodiesterase [Deltaproteobacteria bacterium]
MRVFAALMLPEELAEKLGEVMRSAKSTSADVRWVKPENIHLTLKFLGEQSEEEVREISARIEKAVLGVSAFAVELRGVEIFPSLRRPKVVVANLGGGKGEVLHLFQRIEEALAELNIPREDRDFTAHVTFGRVKSPLRLASLEKELAARRDLLFGEWKISEVCLMQSTLKPEGAQYSVLERYLLREK